MTAKTLSLIDVRTCQDRSRETGPKYLAPSDHEASSLFRVQDPFGLRLAVTPMFSVDDDGNLIGLGTAFAIDPWGTFLTADHVVSHCRKMPKAASGLAPDASYGLVMCDLMPGTRLVTLLGFGLVFGTVKVPDEAILQCENGFTPAIRGNDPLAALQGRVDLSPLDISMLKMGPKPPSNMIANLPMRSMPYGLSVGDQVVAIGYPEIETVEGHLEGVQSRISEGMFASYGTITALYPEGREEGLGNPVFEVDAYWPSGMSGGPVLNMQGEVVGIVSRSIAPGDDGEPGVSFATWLEPFSDLSNWLPSLDPNNPCWRRGWAVLHSNTGSAKEVYPSKEEAEVACKIMDEHFEVVFGSWRLGAEDFISETRY